jgi:hypothetical protein
MVFSFQKHSVGYAVAVFAVVAVVVLQMAQPSVALSCTAATCLDCISIGCGWYPDAGSSTEGSCWESCSAILDAPCYSSLFYVNEAPQFTCEQRVVADADNFDICNPVSDCTVCLSTMKVDGTSTCVWYEATNLCGNGACTSSGCGGATCPDSNGVSDTQSPAPSPDLLNNMPTTTSIECNWNATNCEECLLVNGTKATSCAWVGNQCVDSCSTVPDVKCYSVSSFSDYKDNATAICTIEQQDTIEFEFCGEASECMNCTMTLQSDDVTKCLWYEVMDSSIEPYCGPGGSNTNFESGNQNCDLNGLCGISDCSNRNGSTMLVNEQNGTDKESATSASFSSSQSIVLTMTAMVLWFVAINIPPN